MPAQYGSLPFEQAISFFRNKLNVPTERWNDLWKSNHNSGFMIAGALKDDMLNDFRQAVDSAIAEGKSLSWFKKQFSDIKKQHGWSHTGSEAWRSKVIYDTNMRQSYNAGRFEQLQSFEFWEYQHGDSRQPRALHLSWHNLVLPKTDPWWQTHFPSNGWGCKCRVRGRTKKYLERKGITINAAPKNGTWEWTDKATGELHKIPKGIDPGFDYAPKKSAVTAQRKQIATQKAKTVQPEQRIAPTAFSSVPGADVHSLNAALTKFAPTQQFNQLGQFLTKHDIKTLFLKQTEMGSGTKAAATILPQIEPYLNLGRYTRAYYTTRKASRTNGFTWQNQNHVVVKVKASTRFNKVNYEDLAEAVESAILLMQEGNKQWSLSHIVRVASSSKEHGGALVTWLHEIGHQVHFKAGTPKSPFGVDHAITQYSLTNDKEWHAEHFALWILNRKALAAYNKDIALYFDKLMQDVI